MKRLFAILLAASLLGGCGQSAGPASASSGVSSEEESIAVAEGEVSQAARVEKESKPEMVRSAEKGAAGRVTAIDGNVITLVSMGGGPHNGMERNGKGPKGSADGEVPTDMARDEAPPDQATERTPPGEGGADGTPEKAPNQRNSKPEDAGPDGAETTVTIPDECEILLEQEDGTTTAGAFTEIAVGSLLRITYGEDGETVESVMILSEEKQKPPMGETPSETSSDAESTAP